ncbi:DUF554 domain-containing protein [Eremococcus coleocola]|uniref:DUF554 domain-containing protein n=1 Tax=Eremococcus coleocola ACS-139-V-Col8 TaxID=908337 RepID=E4KP88_9LACT|nr:DUF554 domain-containing protein [Eremococcus coleocola]EFR30950.1 hypothetical protein HMPREF9257_1375 [Eremococcus coleocola ACS-139-V-Col8]
MGAFVNAVAIVLSSVMGLMLKEGIPSNINQRLIQAIGLCIISIGISGALKGHETLIMIVSVMIGTLIGEWVDIDSRIRELTNTLQNFLSRWPRFADMGQGFVTSIMFFCIGSMVIVGSLESGLTGNNTTLYAKSIIDAITALLLSSSLGIGVLFASIPVLIVEGGITLFAAFLEPFLPTLVINEVVAVGSMLLIGLGLNMLEVTDLKIMNFTPAMILPIIIMHFI